MKKTIKLICSLALATSMVLGLSACGNKSDSAPATEDSTKSLETPETTDEPETTDSSTHYSIGILQLVEHPALDKAREGFIDALAEGGYVDGENITIDIQNAQNDQSNLKAMSQKFVNDKVNLILAIATPSALSAATETTEIPILGTAITDYVEAGLVDNAETPNTNLSGTSDRTPVKEQFELMMKILPETKKVGIMYNSSEINSEIQAKLAESAAKDLGLTYEFGTVTSTNDIAQVVQSMAGKVDVLYIPTDNTFASAMATVGTIAAETKLPVIVGENGMCEGGGLATVGIDYYKLGQQTGKMAIRVLNGENVSSMPIEYTEQADICVNLDVAKAIGIEIPKEIVDSAAIIIENGKTVTK